MTNDRPHPSLTPQAAAERLARLDREAAALRANLRRRKEQARARHPPERSETIVRDERDDSDEDA